MSQASITEYGVGYYHAGEAHYGVRSRNTRSGAKRGVIVNGGLNALAKDGGATNDRWLKAGLPQAFFDIVNGAQWGNLTSVARMEEAWALCKSRLGFKTDKALLFGASHGNTVNLAFARAHPDQVAAIISIIGACDIDSIHADGGANAASIDAAYGGDWATNGKAAGRDPIDYAAELAAIPYLALYSGNDPIVHPATTLAHVAAWGANASAVNMGNYGHASSGLDEHAALLSDFLIARA